MQEEQVQVQLQVQEQEQVQVQVQVQEQAFAVAGPEIGQHNQAWDYFQQVRAEIDAPRCSLGAVGTVSDLALLLECSPMPLPLQSAAVASLHSTGHA